MAAKKSFKAELNPALQFISLPPEALENSENLKEQEEQETVNHTVNYNKQKSQSSSQNTAKNQPNKTEEVPTGYKLNPQYIETKSKRVQVLMQPSLYEKIKRKALDKGLSVNEIIHSILDKHTDAN